MQNTIKLSDVIIPENRQRKTFDAEYIDELRRSILSKGLLHPVVVRNDGVTLVAGECRLRALRSISSSGRSYYCDGAEIQPGHVAIVRLGSLADEQVYEAELEENVIRKDLPWQERVAAVTALHNLRVKQNPDQTARDTAEEIFGRKISPATAQVEVRNAAIVAEHLDDPDVKRASNEKEAFKIVEKKVRAKAAADLAKELNPAISPHRAFHGSAQDILPTLPDGYYDVIVTDPPYGMEAGQFGTGQLSHQYADDVESALEIYQCVAIEGFRVAKAEAHLFTFCDIDQFPELKRIFKDAGWEVFRTPLQWLKGLANNTQGHLPWPEYGPRRVCEYLLYAVKGKKKLAQAFTDVIECPPETDKLHAAQKPVDLYVRLLKTSSFAGSKVLDPCCGSGTVFTAADKAQFVADGIELDEATFLLAKSRLAK